MGIGPYKERNGRQVMGDEDGDEQVAERMRGQISG